MGFFGLFKPKFIFEKFTKWGISVKIRQKFAEISGINTHFGSK
jgi:hypothetical protein